MSIAIESIIDHFIVCQAMYNYVVSLQVDEERQFCLTKFTNKTGIKVNPLKSLDGGNTYLELSKQKSRNFSRKNFLLINVLVKY